ncbi:Transcription factor ILR3 [Dichanthelium oligosanthes]|uniref:Transcription factor ILR3 n=1 Tax=Dichanthelium oligosanthes TaxID=888268 RepID=A0A1E5VID6_9POAL|nr:Transcription factor ILR3 [Dichanthelium oligosanthes]
MDCVGGRDPVEDFLLGGAGDDGDLAIFCDGVPSLTGDGGLGIDGVSGDACGFEQSTLGKRGRDEPSSCGPKSKACREKMRRDKLNDRFLELSSVMNPGKQAKLDKANILSDAARMLAQLKGEAEKLKESNEKLRENIKDLKDEKNELREEKVRLKEEKERLEQQVKAMSAAPTGYVPHLPHPAAYHPAAFAPFMPPQQAPTNKSAPIPSVFPGMAMWQWLPQTVVDTTQDPKLWPPNA